MICTLKVSNFESAYLFVYILTSDSLDNGTQNKYTLVTQISFLGGHKK